MPVRDTSNVLTINCIVTAVPDIDGLEELRVFPNPNNGSFDVKLKLNTPKEVSFSLTTITGKIVYQSGVSRLSGIQIKHIDQSRLAAGVYFLQVNIGVKRVIQKIVVAR